MPEMLTRDVQLDIRAVNDEAREVGGIGVPYGEGTDIHGWFDRYRESFARDAVELGGHKQLFWRHDEPIGLVTFEENSERGWEFRARISKTPRGDEAYQLVKDGVIRSFSVGFEPIEHSVDDETGDVTRTSVRVREVSLVPMPAYEGAALEHVRSHNPTREETPMPDSTVDATASVELSQVRQHVDELDRQLAIVMAQRGENAPSVDTRSVGEIVKALSAGDSDTIRAYTEIQARAYEGGTTADSVVKDAWVGDLTRLVEDGDSLADMFSTGTLPSTGMKVEYAQLKSNTVKVDKQASEGADLSHGKVSLETKHAEIFTFGGYTTLSRQEIERSSVNVLDAHFRAMALETRKARRAQFRSHFLAARAAQVEANNTVSLTDATSYAAWVSAIIDAAEKFDDLGLGIDALVADKTVFKTLAALEGSDNRPLMTVYGSGTNVVGEIDAARLGGNLAGVPVRLSLKQTTPGATFINKAAIRSYNSPVVSLSDENVVNLSNAFSVYYYGGIANEIPAAIVPVAIAGATDTGTE